MFFHGEDLAPLSQYIHPSVLPVEFGGRGPPFDNTEWMEVIESRIDTIRKMLEYGYKDWWINPVLYKKGTEINWWLIAV